MPAASSPYQGNDYNAVSNFRPYQLPVNDIFKAIKAQDEFWDAGAERVKSVYDNALNLSLSLQPNKELRDKFMQDANQQIIKLSSMDLSDPSVQRQGFGIFKPLFQDEGIMSDDQATKHIAQVNADALRYRDTNNGKAYSATNHQYALTGAREFKNSQDRMAGKAYLQQAKDYEPFYDPSSELNSILKNCKPDKGSNTTVQGFYIDTYSSESLSSAKINSCLDAGLSDRAKRQLQINGAVIYRDNPYALRDKYVPYLQGTISQLSQQKAAIAGVLVNKNNLTNLKKEDLAKLGITDISQITPEFLKQLQQTSDNIDGRLTNLNDTTSRLARGDFSPIQGDNFERVASTVFSRDYMQNVGEGFSYDFNTNTRKADPVQMMEFTQSQINERQNNDHQFQLKIEEMKLNADRALKIKMSGSLKNLLGLSNAEDIINDARIQNDTTSPFTAIDKSDTYDAVTAKRQDIANQRAQLNKWQYTKLQTSFGMPADIRQGSPEEQKFWDNFVLTGRGDPVKDDMIKNFTQKMDLLIAQEDLYRGTQNSVDTKLAPIEKDLNQKISNIKDNVTVNGVIITANDVMDALNGKGNKLNIISKATNINFGGQQGQSISGSSSTDTYFANGHPIAGGSNIIKLNDLVRQVRVKIGEKTELINKTRNQLMGQETALQREGYLFPEMNTFDEKNPEGSFKGKVAQQLEMTGKNLVDKITIGQTDLDGRVIVTVAPATKGETDYDHKKAMEKLLTYGGVGNVKVDDNTVMLVNVDSLDLIDNNSMTSVMKPYIRSLENNTTLTQPQSTAFMRSGSGYSYRLKVSASPGSGFDYEIINQDAPTSPVYTTTSREDALGQFQNLLKRVENRPKLQTTNAR